MKLRGGSSRHHFSFPVPLMSTTRIRRNPLRLLSINFRKLKKSRNFQFPSPSSDSNMNLRVIVQRRLMIICFFNNHFLPRYPRGQSCCNEGFLAWKREEEISFFITAWISLTIYLSWLINVVVFPLASFRLNWQDHLCELWANIEP